MMNQQGSKKILFNKSTLLSLKAELLKKQEEVKEKKHLPQNKLENFKPPSAQKEVKPNKKSFNDNLQEIDTDDLEAHKKSKSALEKKAELYEHLSDGAGTSQLSAKFLVDFSLKKSQEPTAREPSPEPDGAAHYNDDDDGDEWTDFVDCLGRSRRCLKTDVELYKKRDQELIKSMSRETQGTEHKQQPEVPVEEVQKPLLVQKTDDYLQSLRDKWEAKEKELLEKDKDVHYQDLLFDEARQHGVSYYSFSTEDEERRRQMAELLRVRQETERAQREAEDKRTERDALIAARVNAARARKRERAGLPPLEPAEKKVDFTLQLLEYLADKKNEAATKAKEEERKLREEAEKQKQVLREAYVREWDVGKGGKEESNKGFRQMTQEEYEEQQRSKRIDEFAPLQWDSSLSGHRQSNRFDNKGRFLSAEDDNLTQINKTWADVRPPLRTEFEEHDEASSNKRLFFSSATETSHSKYKNCLPPPVITPIVNEINAEEGIEDTEESREVNKRKFASTGQEVAPPPTYDYYGPTPKQTRPEKPFTSSLHEAYEQGVKVLQAKEEKRKMAKDLDFLY